MNASILIKDDPKKFNLLIENVQDFHIKKDFMFATRKVLNSTQLFISYKRERFIRADFQTELEIRVRVAPAVTFFFYFYIFFSFLNNMVYFFMWTMAACKVKEWFYFFARILHDLI